MSLDRQLVETIKRHFAGKLSAQLQEVVRTNDLQRWSPEAIAAAGEVLEDRSAGRAQEPLVAEKDPRPLRSPTVPYSLGLLIGFLPVLVMNGFRFGSEFAADDDDPDLPVPFGPRTAWLAVETTDTEGVTTDLDLRGARAATWAEGIKAATQTSRSSVFVTPPLADWTLAVGTALFPSDQAETFVKPLLERLSAMYGEAQYFGTHRDVELHMWARARNGRLLRGYGWLGEKGLTLWDEGAPTKGERDLGLRSAGAQAPDEATLMQLACLWSIDPTSLNEHFKEPMTGLLGEVPWAGSGRETGIQA
jgi:hypothetical protein